MWRRVCLSMLLLFLAAILVSQGVVAYFYDTAQNANNTFATGTWTAIPSLHPEIDSKDKTGPQAYNLNSTELAYLETSDDTWYEGQVGWPATYAVQKRLDFSFPDIPANVTVTSVAITVEWAWLSNLTDPGAHAKVRVLRSPGNWTEYNLTAPSIGYTDIIETIDISDYVQTFEHVNYLQARFYAEFAAVPPETIKTRHDLVEVLVNYS